MLNVFKTRNKGLPPNSLLILRKFKQINELLFPLKSSENRKF